MKIFQPTITGSFSATSSMVVTGSLNISNGITGSLFGTSSYSLYNLSSSFSLTASYIDGGTF